MVGRYSRQGVQDWLVQRVTAVLILAYSVLIIARLLCPVFNNQAAWHALFSHQWMKVATLLVVASALWHAWIGLWTVFTDYVKPTGWRYTLQTLLLIALASMGIWALLLVVR